MLLSCIALAFVAGIVAVVDGSPARPGEKRAVPETHILHERGMPHWEYTWSKKERLPSDALLPMRIGMKQSNLEQGHNILMDM